MTGWAGVWPSSTWVVGGHHKMNTGVTRLQPCLVPEGGRALRLGPTDPSQELSGSHKTTPGFVCLPKDAQETFGSVWAASCSSGLRHLLSKELP